MAAVGVGVELISDLLVGALPAALYTTADAGAVESSVVRAKLAFTAIPKRRHDAGSRTLRALWWNIKAEGLVGGCL